ncbi:MAG: hypothetical protein JXB15_07165 [Anaerolineales bacterium]|nr:hypothetical protein [Anaerolineales bacterium]
MKTTHIRIFLIVTASAVLLILIASHLPVGEASAAVGNQGIPARCWVTLNPGYSDYFYCEATGGVSFIGDSWVPTGYYFLVTDVVISPTGTSGTGATNFSSITVEDGATGHALYSIVQTTQDKYGGSFHYTTPYLVVESEDGLWAYQKDISSTRVSMYLSGLLTTNVNYLTLITR